MILKYKNDFTDYLNHYDLLYPHAFRHSRDSYYASLSLPVLIGFAGIGGSWNENPFIGCLIAAALGYYLFSALPYSKIYQRSLNASLKLSQEKQIHLELHDRGLTEHIDGIESFCPWSSMLYFQQFRETVFIELKPTLWAIIPSRHLSSDSPPLTELVTALRKNGVLEKTPGNRPQ